MKKMFFYAAVACVAFASCSKDNGVEVPSYNAENEDAPQAIQLQMGSSFDVTTRGTGAVGGVTAEENVWNKQTLNVYMFNKGSLELAYNKTTSDYYFDGDTVTAPKGVNSGNATYGTLQYYPSTGNFDFFAYHADSANIDVNGNLVAPELNENGDAYTVDVTIDGTQDLMVAKAWLNNADSTTYESENSYDYKRVYSAYSARRGVNPRFAFKHLLSRFVFQAEAKEVGAAGVDGIKITKIEVKAPVNGTMTVAALNEIPLGVDFGKTAADSAVLNLRDRGADTIAVKELKLNELVALGESMLLPAYGTQYVADIYYEQVKGDTIKDVYTATINLKNNASFQPGTQYKVNIKVYDFKQIVLTADLTPWTEGEDVPLDSEEE